VFSFRPPESIATGSSIAGNPYAVVYLPVDAELEANAKQWLSSDNKDRRWLGARGLIFFKSDANAALLRSRLTDDGTWSRTQVKRLLGPPYRFPEFLEFLVRWEAWSVLNGWGIETPQPALSATSNDR
jgi:hypothetical protein